MSTLPHGQGWDPGLYDQKHGFITHFGTDLLPLLAPQPGERILDLGCGTGHLTAQIAAAGADVIGMDHSPEMVAQVGPNTPISASSKATRATSPSIGPTTQSSPTPPCTGFPPRSA